MNLGLLYNIIIDPGRVRRGEVLASVNTKRVWVHDEFAAEQFRQGPDHWNGLAFVFMTEHE